MTGADVTIRRALAADAATLSALAFRSKSYWPYDAALLERLRPALTVSVEYVAAWPVYVAEDHGRCAGFYGFRSIDGETFLHDFWVDPPLIGTGIGRALWHHALRTARAHEYTSFLIESDPNAEPFYIRMGARRARERVSPDSGRLLPLLRYDLKR